MRISLHEFKQLAMSADEFRLCVVTLSLDHLQLCRKVYARLPLPLLPSLAFLGFLAIQLYPSLDFSYQGRVSRFPEGSRVGAGFLCDVVLAY